MEPFLSPAGQIRFCFPFQDNGRVLIVAPHPDDESIGCGGIIQKLLSRGAQVQIILMTCGATGEKRNVPDLREKEFDLALERLNCCNAVKLRYPDGQLSGVLSSAIGDMVQAVTRFQPQAIFVPYYMDPHPDHFYTNFILGQSLKQVMANSGMTVASYEVWTPILYPNCFIDVTKQFACKNQALECYASQNSRYAILKRARLLNALRAASTRHYRANYMEAFELHNAADYINIICNRANIWKEADRN